MHVTVFVKPLIVTLHLRYFLVILVIAKDATIKDLFQNPENSNKFVYLGELDGAHIYRLELK